MWEVSVGGRTRRYTEILLREAIAAGRMDGDAACRQDGQGAWWRLRSTRPWAEAVAEARRRQARQVAASGLTAGLVALGLGAGGWAMLAAGAGAAAAWWVRRPPGEAVPGPEPVVGPDPGVVGDALASALAARRVALEAAAASARRAGAPVGAAEAALAKIAEAEAALSRARAEDAAGAAAAAAEDEVARVLAALEVEAVERSDGAAGRTPG